MAKSTGELNSPAVLSVAVVPVLAREQDKLSEALTSICGQDPSLGVVHDVDSGRTVLQGQSELHLSSIIERLQREFTVGLKADPPQIIYRETVTRRVTVDYTHKRVTDGSPGFARVKLLVEPAARGDGAPFLDGPAGIAIPKGFIGAIEVGVREALQAGARAGFPVVDLKITVVDTDYHERDSSELSFEAAGRQALREALTQAEPILLEPIMTVEIAVPASCSAAVLHDLRRRRSEIEICTAGTEMSLIRARTSLADLLGYVDTLAVLTQGRGRVTMQFYRFEPVPSLFDDPPFRPAMALRTGALLG